MRVKILYHFMPWEIDYAHFNFFQLKKSFYHLQKEVKVEIESVLNLSSYIIDWEKSQIPKHFFIEKYNSISSLLNCYDHKTLHLLPKYLVFHI